MLRVGSKVGVPQIEAPPCCQEVPAQVAGAVVQNRHNSLPVAGAYASKCPRTANSPPVTPTSTSGIVPRLAPMYCGASVMPAPFEAVSTCTFHTTAPVVAFRATKFPSSRASKTNPPPTATPRLSLLQQTGSVEILTMS